MRHGRMLLVGMLFLISSGFSGKPWTEISPQAAAAEPLALYKPKREDYRAAYDADTSNQAKQSWDSYYEWVETFYRGNFFARGWTRQSEQVISHVNQEKARGDVRMLLEELGRKISQEWSKDNSVRRIDTNDLQTIGKQIDQSTSQDDGSGDKILAALINIRDEVSKKLK